MKKLKTNRQKKEIENEKGTQVRGNRTGQNNNKKGEGGSEETAVF